MRVRAALIALAAILTACTPIPLRPPGPPTVYRPISATDRRPALLRPRPPAAAALEQRRRVLAALALLDRWYAIIESPVGKVSRTPCGGGDYPPCWRVDTESGGRYDAISPPSFCGGHGCFGKWEFSGAWAGKLTLRADIANTSPAMQDEAARLLWDHGRGCSNWSAC